MSCPKCAAKAFYAFMVPKEVLGRFINRSQEHDSMGGNNVEVIEKIDDKTFTVVISRTFGYPYVIGQLLEIAPLA